MSPGSSSPPRSACGRPTIRRAHGPGSREHTMISVFDLFSIVIGSSCSHTVGPRQSAAMFAGSLAGGGALGEVAGIRAELFGSLAATGYGHGSVPAVVLGLSRQ